MGKYPNSKIHEKYSDWHWQLVQIDDKYRRLYVADIDRLWIEYDFEKKAVVAIIDLKWKNSDDGMTATEKGIYDWFLLKGVGYYIVYITQDFKIFEVHNSRGQIRILNSIEYADWLLSLRTANYNNRQYELFKFEL